MWTKKHFQLALLILACLFVSTAAANAQDRLKGELFVGFSGRTNGDPILKGWNASAALHIDEQLAIVADFSGHYGNPPNNQAVHGVITGVIGIAPPTPSNGTTPAPSTIRIPVANSYDLYTFLAGPQFSHRINGRARVFVRALFGASRTHLRMQTGPPVPSFLSFVPGPPLPAPGQPAPAPIGSAVGCIPSFASAGITPAIKPYLSLYPVPSRCSSDTQTGFSFGAGGGLDVTIAKHWAVRVLQADYLNKQNVLGQGSNDFRLASGLLYQW